MADPRVDATADKPRSQHATARRTALLYLLEKVDRSLIKEACTAAGMTGDHSSERFIEHFQRCTDFNDPPREAQARVFTEQVLDAAIAYGLDHSGKYKDAAFVQKLVEEGVLPYKPRDTTYFFDLFDARAHELGLHPHHGAMKYAAMQAAKDPYLRKKYCREVIHFCKVEGSISDLMFGDETSYLQHPHPKCK
jgi:hypothetical protein